MNLPQDIICFQLEKEFALCYLKKCSRNLSYSRPVFFEPDLSGENLTLLVDYNHSLTANNPLLSGSLLILLQTPESELLHIDATIILIEDAITFQMLFNALQKIFNLFDRWDSLLQKSVFENGSFQDQIDACDLILDEWILLVDHKFHYAAFSKSCELVFDETVVDEHYNMPLDAVNDFISDHKFQVLYDEKDIFLYESITPEGTDQMLCQNFFNQDGYAGRLIIILKTDRSDSIKTYIKSILKHLYHYSQQLFEKYQSLDIRQFVLNSMREPLVNLLSNIKQPIDSWQQIALENGWYPRDQLQLIQLASKASYTKNIYREFLGSEFEAQWPGCISLFFEDRLLLLINLDLYKNTRKNDFYQQLPLFLRESLLIAGFSRTFTDINDLRIAYTQTQIALDFGQTHAVTAWIHYFDDLATHYMLKSAPGDFKKEQICSSKLLALQKYDAARHTEYYQTLSAYFQCRLNASLTAKTLHIHRSSLLTRLERMKKLFTINFDTDDDLLYLLLSWLIMEQVND